MDQPQVEVRSRDELRKWLATNHATAGSHWLVVWKKHTPHYLPWSDAVSELLCWGWVDSVTRKVDDDRSSYRIAPRNPRSAWSAVNKSKVEELRAAGLMQPSGEAIIAEAEKNGMWTFLDDVEAGILPDDLDQALQEQGLRAVWDSYPRSVTRGTLEWIKTAKTPGTRSKRIDDVIKNAGAGKRPSPFQRG